MEKLLRQVLLVSGLGSGSAQAIAIAIILGISTIAYIRRNPLIERNLNYQQVRTYTTPTQPTDKHRNLSRLSSSLMLRCLPFLIDVLVFSHAALFAVFPGLSHVVHLPDIG